MKVSVLVPTRNRLDYLREAVESVLMQTHTDLEVVVSDDGSSDGTVAWVEQRAASDSRIRLLVDNPRPGVFENFNHLVAACTGDAFCILGDDDRLHPRFVERLVAPLVERRAVMSFCDHNLIDSNGALREPETRKNSDDYGRTALPEGIVEHPTTAAVRSSICIGFAMFRSDAFKDERFDLECGGAADVDFAFRAIQKGNAWFVKERLADYRCHPGGTSVTKHAYMSRGLVYALSKQWHVEHPADVRAVLTRRLKAAALTYAYLASPVDRRECLNALRWYLRAGGAVTNVKLFGTLAFAALPRGVAPRLAGEVRKLRSLDKRR